MVAVFTHSNPAKAVEVKKWLSKRIPDEVDIDRLVTLLEKGIELAITDFETGGYPAFHMHIRCRQGRHRSNAVAAVVAKWLRSHGFDAFIIAHDLKISPIDNRGPAFGIQ